MRSVDDTYTGVYIVMSARPTLSIVHDLAMEAFGGTAAKLGSVREGAQAGDTRASPGKTGLVLPRSLLGKVRKGAQEEVIRNTRERIGRHGEKKAVGWRTEGKQKLQHFVEETCHFLLRYSLKGGSSR